MVRRLLAYVSFSLCLFAGPIWSAEEVKEVHVSFEQAETEVLMLFRQDLSRLETLTKKIAIFEVNASGELPPNYQNSLRGKLERVILNAKTIQLVDCAQCQASRLVKDADGKFRYEVSSEEPGRAAKLGSQLGVDDFLYAEMVSDRDDMRLKVRLVSAHNNQVRWSHEYSTAQVMATREKVIQKEYNIEEIGQGDNLSRVMIGEIAFSVAFSPGIALLPTIDEGSGSTRVFYPSVDVLVGEKFDQGYKRFGFLFGAFVNASEAGPMTQGKLLPFALRVAPQYRYTFNPYNTTSARISLMTELGGLIGSGLTTAYFGMGPEFTVVRRFSVSLMPMYVLPTTVKGMQVVVQNEGKEGETPKAAVGSGPDQGKFGGFALLIKGTFNW